MSRRVPAALLAATVTTLALAGCSSNPTAGQSTALGSTGTIGPITVTGALVVGTDVGGDLQSSFANAGSQPDQLTALTLNGQPVTLPTGPVPLLPLSANSVSDSSRLELPLTSLPAQPGQLVTIQYSFRDAGLLDVTALVASPQLVNGAG